MKKKVLAVLMVIGIGCAGISAKRLGTFRIQHCRQRK